MPSTLQTAADSARLPVLVPKLVMAKDAPSTLIARDESRCLVTSTRFAETREGDEVWCVWTSGR